MSDETKDEERVPQDPPAEADDDEGDDDEAAKAASEPSSRAKGGTAPGGDAPGGKAEPKAGDAASAPPPYRSPPAIGAAVLAVVALVALDLWTKHWAEETLSTAREGEAPPLCEPGPNGYSMYQRDPGPAIVLIDGVLELDYAENCGAAFSLFDGLPAPLRHGIFYVAALMATIVLSRMFVQGKGGRWFEVAVPMVIAGALGNFHDRVRFGYVVDFIHTYWQGHFDYPVWNVADSAVVLGVIALVIDSYREKKEPAPAPAVSETAKPA